MLLGKCDSPSSCLGRSLRRRAMTTLLALCVTLQITGTTVRAAMLDCATLTGVVNVSAIVTGPGGSRDLQWADCNITNASVVIRMSAVPPDGPPVSLTFGPRLNASGAASLTIVGGSSQTVANATLILVDSLIRVTGGKHFLSVLAATVVNVRLRVSNSTVEVSSDDPDVSVASFVDVVTLASSSIEVEGSVLRVGTSSLLLQGGPVPGPRAAAASVVVRYGLTTLSDVSLSATQSTVFSTSSAGSVAALGVTFQAIPNNYEVATVNNMTLLCLSSNITAAGGERGNVIAAAAVAVGYGSVILTNATLRVTSSRVGATAYEGYAIAAGGVGVGYGSTTLSGVTILVASSHVAAGATLAAFGFAAVGVGLYSGVATLHHVALAASFSTISVATTTFFSMAAAAVGVATAEGTVNLTHVTVTASSSVVTATGTINSAAIAAVGVGLHQRTNMPGYSTLTLSHVTFLAVSANITIAAGAQGAAGVGVGVYNGVVTLMNVTLTTLLSRIVIVGGFDAVAASGVGVYGHAVNLSHVTMTTLLSHVAVTGRAFLAAGGLAVGFYGASTTCNLTHVVMEAATATVIATGYNYNFGHAIAAVGVAMWTENEGAVTLSHVTMAASFAQVSIVADTSPCFGAAVVGVGVVTGSAPRGRHELSNVTMRVSSSNTSAFCQGGTAVAAVGVGVDQGAATLSHVTMGALRSNVTVTVFTIGQGSAMVALGVATFNDAATLTHVTMAAAYSTVTVTPPAGTGYAIAAIGLGVYNSTATLTHVTMGASAGSVTASGMTAVAVLGVGVFQGATTLTNVSMIATDSVIVTATAGSAVTTVGVAVLEGSANLTAVTMVVASARVTAIGSDSVTAVGVGVKTGPATLNQIIMGASNSTVTATSTSSGHAIAVGFGLYDGGSAKHSVMLIDAVIASHSSNVTVVGSAGTALLGVAMWPAVDAIPLSALHNVSLVACESRLMLRNVGGSVAAYSALLSWTHAGNTSLHAVVWRSDINHTGPPGACSTLLSTVAASPTTTNTSFDVFDANVTGGSCLTMQPAANSASRLCHANLTCGSVGWPQSTTTAGGEDVMVNGTTWVELSPLLPGLAWLNPCEPRSCPSFPMALPLPDLWIPWMVTPAAMVTTQTESATSTGTPSETDSSTVTPSTTVTPSNTASSTPTSSPTATSTATITSATVSPTSMPNTATPTPSSTGMSTTAATSASATAPVTALNTSSDNVTTTAQPIGTAPPMTAVATATASVSVVATTMSVSTPGVLVMAQRVSSVTSALACPNVPVARPSVFLHPLGLTVLFRSKEPDANATEAEVSRSLAATYALAAVANIAVLLPIGIVAFAAAVAGFDVVRRRWLRATIESEGDEESSLRTRLHPLRAVMMATTAPVCVVVPALVFMTRGLEATTVAISVTEFAIPSATAMWCVIVALCVGLVAFVLQQTTGSRFLAHSVPRSMPVESVVPPKVQFAMTGGVTWEPLPDNDSDRRDAALWYHSRVGKLYDEYREHRQWWLAADSTASTLAAVLGNVRSTSPIVCRTALSLLLIVLVSVVVAQLVLRPFAAPVSIVHNLTVAVASLVACAFAFAPATRGWSEAISTFATAVAAARIFLDAALAALGAMPSIRRALLTERARRSRQHHVCLTAPLIVEMTEGFAATKDPSGPLPPAPPVVPVHRPPSGTIPQAPTTVVPPPQRRPAPTPHDGHDQTCRETAASNVLDDFLFGVAPQRSPPLPTVLPAAYATPLPLPGSRPPRATLHGDRVYVVKEEDDDDGDDDVTGRRATGGGRGLTRTTGTARHNAAVNIIGGSIPDIDEDRRPRREPHAAQELDDFLRGLTRPLQRSDGGKSLQQ